MEARPAHCSAECRYLSSLLLGSVQHRSVETRLELVAVFVDMLGIGNAKILNEDTGNDLLTETKMSSYEYT